MISGSDLVGFLDEFLSIDDIKDDSRNGIQVDADTDLDKIAFAVDVRKDILKRAVDADADMLFVHHGFIWGNGLGPLRGKEYHIVKELVKNDIGLYAAHLPLDVHPEVGNNVQLAKTIGAKIGEPFMEYNDTDIARMAYFKKEKRVEYIAETLEDKLETETSVLGGKKKVKKVGILTGKGGMALKAAKENDAELFLTGERTYMAYNEALDLDMPLIFAGHYATETLGVMKMEELVKKKFAVETTFLSSKTTI